MLFIKIKLVYLNMTTVNFVNNMLNVKKSLELSKITCNFNPVLRYNLN